MGIKSGSLLLLSLNLIHKSMSATCPDSSKLPFSCQCFDFIGSGVEIEIACSGASVEELIEALQFIDSSARLQVQLNSMSLQTLPSRIFAEWNLVKLEIAECDLVSLVEQGEVALSGLENTLEELIISSSFTETDQPSKLDLSHLRRLRELDLSFNAITELSNDWFSRGPDTLSDLVLSNNGIEKLGDWAFANLINIRLLWLDGNRFGPIKRSMLPNPALWLENLQLDNNAFSFVPDDMFSKMPALTDISLANNGLLHLPETTYEIIWSQLMTFDIRGNPIECDSHIEWIIEAESDVEVSGTCYGPLGRSGMDLGELIEKRRQHF
ncbi:chaoptin-like [Argiope bruennichi]|uniref:chaoptin-like n=1 Tax=Argiope bruennichi TaxID=94029 RepID=UPI002495061F|nr:chaoptin-like [Argiope bruennichi]XP_055948157.1 chaoptin-like [Argiope bruennichi]